MMIYEYSRDLPRTFLLIATAALEPFWAFRDAIDYLSKDYHVYAVVADGYDQLHDDDFQSIEDVVDKMIEAFKLRGVTSFDGAYGLSMGGAILNRLLSVSSLTITKAVLDGAIMPYTYPPLITRVIAIKDYLMARLLTSHRQILELVAPPETYTPVGHDPQKEYDDLMSFYKTYSRKTIYNTFYSANNYQLPQKSPNITTTIEYWYGEHEEKARHKDISYIKHYYPKTRFIKIKGLGHGMLVMVYPKLWYRYIKKSFASN